MNNQTATELINRNTINIDIVSTQDILTMINNEDMTIATAVQKCIPQITRAVDIIVKNFLRD